MSTAHKAARADAFMQEFTNSPWTGAKEITTGAEGERQSHRHGQPYVDDGTHRLELNKPATDF
jgi:hypothetical protein